jgi:hypothetical protein
MGKTGHESAQKNVHCAHFSGHRDLDASVMVNRGQEAVFNVEHPGQVRSCRLPQSRISHLILKV